MHDHDDDQQGFLVRQAIAYAAAGDYFKIDGLMVDALIASRQDLIDSTISVIVADREPF